jgi:hypothetical protein
MRMGHVAAFLQRVEWSAGVWCSEAAACYSDNGGREGFLLGRLVPVPCSGDWRRRGVQRYPVRGMSRGMSRAARGLRCSTR